MGVLVVVVLVMFLVGCIIRTPQFKGWLGEKFVNFFTWLFLDPKTYRLIPDVTIPHNGGSTQIDHVIVSPYGIFVVETKNWKGAIYGRQDEAYWTVKLGGKTYRKQNPLRQNYAHTKTLSEILGLPESKFKSVIVLGPDADFKKERPENVSIGAGFVWYIRKQKECLLTKEEVEAVLASIAEKRFAPGWKTRRDHVRRLKERHESRD
ncbi:MAG TPA: nuclease-related domain-containing protein [Planctomycetota bacterium]|nr:nuclease-related domain-containing protein [Planctomycetota bacterium]